MSIPSGLRERVEAGRWAMEMVLSKGPWIPSRIPYRVVVLHGQPRGSFKKTLWLSAHLFPTGSTL